MNDLQSAINRNIGCRQLVRVSGAADQDGEDLFSGTDLVYNVEENGHHMGKNRPSVLPFIFLILI